MGEYDTGVKEGRQDEFEVMLNWLQQFNQGFGHKMFFIKSMLILASPVAFKLM